MSQLGVVMASEIAETPKVFKAILDNSNAFESVKNVLTEEKIQSVLILARGTSDNAAHYLKYLIAACMPSIKASLSSMVL